MVAIRRHIRCVWWHRCCKITVPIVIPVYTNTPQSLLPWGEEAYKTNTISLKLIRDACEHTLITSNKFFIKFYEFFFYLWNKHLRRKLFHVKVFQDISRQGNVIYKIQKVCIFEFSRGESGNFHFLIQNFSYPGP